MQKLEFFLGRTRRRGRREAATLAGCARGNVAVPFALVLIPLLCLMGGGIDVFRVFYIRDTAQQAADVAAIIGAKAAESYLNEKGLGASQINQALDTAVTAATRAFSANTRNIAELKSVVPTVTLSADSTGVTARVRPTFTVSTAFLGLVGINTMESGTTAVAKVGGLETYYQIVFVVDVSGSMGIGGTSADIAALQSNSYIQCAFACHDPNNQEGMKLSSWCKLWPADQFCINNAGSYCPWGTNGCLWYDSPYADRRATARTAGIKLKIDYVNSAIADFMTQLSPAMTAKPNNFAVGITTLGTSYTRTLAPSTSLTQVNSAVNNIDLEVVVPLSSNYGYSYLTSGLNSTLASITNVGDGSSITARKTYFVFLSDGVEDIPGSILFGRGTGTNYTTACTAIKAANINMMTILAPYPSIPNDTSYNMLVAPMVSNIAPAMKSCASSADNYFMASDGPAIKAAVRQVFVNIFGNSPAHLTQ